MSLPESYLRYPNRRYGLDQARYAWRPEMRRERLAWPEDRAVAVMVVVPIEHHMLNPSGKPFRHPGAVVTPYPDLRHYTTRDYGNRVGIFRILDALRSAGIRATVPVNACQLGRLKPLLKAIAEDGHEIAAHGLSTDHVHWSGLDAGVEAAWVAEVRARFDDAGLRPRTWLSPARQQSFATPDLIAQAGFDVCLDWEQDDTPVAMRTSAGELMALALSNELDDRLLLLDRRQTETDWVLQILEAVAYLRSGKEAFGGRMLGFTLTPYVTGQPFRSQALRQVLGALGADGGVWAATACEIADAACTALSPGPA